ncbi:hypothetical protein [Thiocapsa marina]|uniref:Uncharacterized protein n=1 Tax=Thiocapsa marina 5811 TaxID=768671 RepID=F9UH25_9GAMM|nr:hypothetical protein [Thiocapsa marina]EGV16429.1 hypothetical protein ThimaDRAFT_4198 [Thiocapsa marina 5811]
MVKKPLSDEEKGKIARFQHSLSSESYPPYWRCLDGEQLTGIIKAMETRPNVSGVMQDVIVVQEKNDDIWSVWVNGYIKTALELRKATIGSVINIKCGGKVKVEFGHDYNALQIRILN